jgi:hypothetical protein
MYWYLSILGVLLAIWPFIGGYSNIDSALWSSVILGAVITLSAGYKAATNDTGKWSVMLIGIAGAVAAFSPLLLGFSQAQTATGTMILIGGTVASLSMIMSDLDPENPPYKDLARPSGDVHRVVHAKAASAAE